MFLAVFKEVFGKSWLDDDNVVCVVVDGGISWLFESIVVIW
jgi:hypothetical protein